MLKILSTNKYKKQLKKLYTSGKFSHKLKDELNDCINGLANNKQLDIKYKDHKLTGYKENIREFHLRPDILVIYSKEHNELLLTLIQIGSHSELF
jgi:mRNA interferase YafQ